MLSWFILVFNFPPISSIVTMNQQSSDIYFSFIFFSFKKQIVPTIQPTFINRRKIKKMWKKWVYAMVIIELSFYLHSMLMMLCTLHSTIIVIIKIASTDRHHYYRWPSPHHSAALPGQMYVLSSAQHVMKNHFKKFFCKMAISVTRKHITFQFNFLLFLFIFKSK